MARAGVAQAPAKDGMLRVVSDLWVSGGGRDGPRFRQDRYRALARRPKARAEAMRQTPAPTASFFAAHAQPITPDETPTTRHPATQMPGIVNIDDRPFSSESPTAHLLPPAKWNVSHYVPEFQESYLNLVDRWSFTRRVDGAEALDDEPSSPFRP